VVTVDGARSRSGGLEQRWWGAGGGRRGGYQGFARLDPAEFIVGNILTDLDIAGRLDDYNVERLETGTNPTCRSCGIAESCGKGCPAAVIAGGGRVEAVDAALCPITTATLALDSPAKSIGTLRLIGNSA
jgi:radical SAM protein with 4Fe4S-binding SPASM domain